jgi:competence protein ComEA
VRLSSRRSDDADVIRARLRMLLEESNRSRGWVPEDDPGGFPDPDGHPEQDGFSDPADWDADGVTAPVGPADEPPTGLPSGLGRHRAPGRTARWDPGRLGSRSLWIAGLVAALVLVAWTWLDRPRVEPAPVVPVGRAASTSTPAEPSVGEVADTSATVVVSVVGSVPRPGLVTLPSGSRVAAAVEAAGGLGPDADPASVNLAAVVTDGQQIVVGAPGSAGAGASGSAATAAGGKIDLNTATAAELDALPGVGPVLAQRIVDHRDQEPFTSVDQLDDVPGIGPARAAELAELVTV